MNFNLIGVGHHFLRGSSSKLVFFSYLLSVNLVAIHRGSLKPLLGAFAEHTGRRCFLTVVTSFC